MTIVRNRKKYVIHKKTYFVEQYAEKPYFYWLWRYGYIGDKYSYIISSGLRSRPNLKRLGL